jgi:hypothetical protein
VPSYTSSLLEELSESLKGNTSPEKEVVIRNTGSALYAAGADTVCPTICLSLMSLNTHCDVDREFAPYVLSRHGSLPRSPTKGTEGAG